MVAVTRGDEPGSRSRGLRKGTESNKRKVVTAVLKLRETEGNFTSRDIEREASVPGNQSTTRTLRSKCI